MAAITDFRELLITNNELSFINTQISLQILLFIGSKTKKSEIFAVMQSYKNCL